MEKDWEDEDSKEKKSREGVKVTREMRKIKGGKQRKGYIGKKMFFMKALSILSVIEGIEKILKKTEKQKLGDQNVSLQLINSKFWQVR